MKLNEPTRKPSRSRAANKELRRQQLIDATMDCIDKLGFADTTLAKVAEKAGLSQGIVIFHFKSKEMLFEQTLRFLAFEYRRVTEQALERSPDTAIDKLCTLIRSDFDPKICNPTKVGIWHSFWGEAKTRPLYKDLYGAVDLEITDNMQSFCEELSESETARLDGRSASLAIDSVINGLWQKCFLTPKRFNRQEAIEATFDMVEAFYPDHLETIEKYKRKLK